jgi:mRNA interferase RelE/StbE
MAAPLAHAAAVSKEPSAPPAVRAGPRPIRYSLQWLRAALKDARALPGDHLERMRAVVRGLVEVPRPPNASAKHGPLKGLLGIAVGRFRILYRVDDVHRLVEILRVGDRKEIYR